MPESDAWQGRPQVINASVDWVQLMATHLLVLPPVSEWSFKALGYSKKSAKNQAK